MAGPVPHITRIIYQTMAESTKTNTIPTALTVHKQSRVLEIAFDSGETFSLPFEFLRVYSPSAEVRGHGAGQEVLQTGKRNVLLTAVAPVGNYAVQLNFSDGHDSGLYSWDYLFWLGAGQAQLWEDYLKRLESGGFTRESGRDAPMPVKAGGCH